eukprot:6176877-Pleurochrysis_carterae.AAC.1
MDSHALQTQTADGVCPKTSRARTRARTPHHANGTAARHEVRSNGRRGGSVSNDGRETSRASCLHGHLLRGAARRDVVKRKGAVGGHAPEQVVLRGDKRCIL